MLNNRAAQTVREAELNSRKGIIARKQINIDDLNEQIKQKKMEEDTLQRRERTREEAVRVAEMRQREAMQREKEREKQKAQEEELKQWFKEAQIRRKEQIQRTSTDRVRKEREAGKFRNPYQTGEAEEEREANVNRGKMPNMRRESAFETESTNYEQSAGATASKASCLHRSWWDQQGGKHICERCSTTTSRYAFRCPSCQTVACARCRNIMKSKVCLFDYWRSKSVNADNMCPDAVCQFRGKYIYIYSQLYRGA